VGAHRARALDRAGAQPQRGRVAAGPRPQGHCRGDHGPLPRYVRRRSDAGSRNAGCVRAQIRARHIGIRDERRALARRCSMEQKGKSVMAAISASMVKELREKTGAGMMDCKAALTETAGAMEPAIDWLRKKGLAKAAKKSGRVAA